MTRNNNPSSADVVDHDVGLDQQLLDIFVNQPTPQAAANRHMITSGAKRNPAKPDRDQRT
jgi:hypothetical protein